MSVVTEEMVRAFLAALIETGKPCDVNTGAIRAALAAVAPPIAAAERERCARVADDKATEMYAIAASAKDEGDQDRCERMTYRGNGAKAAAAAIRALDAPAFVVATVEPDGSIKMRHEGDV